MASLLTSSNRVNIPAVCRIRGSHATGSTVGTGVLVGAGIILTSRFAVGSTKEEAANLTATFFEGTKKRVVDVKLLPHKYFFTAAYPEFMDYCLVACEEDPLLHVMPVHVPLTQREWTAVCEGDVVLVVQHPIVEPEDLRRLADGSNGTADGQGFEGDSSEEDPYAPHSDTAASTHSVLEQKRFEEVLRCRDSIYYLKTNGLTRTAGCPAFNDLGNLIGLQSQRPAADGEGIVNRIVSIVAIVQHMFAMKQLAVLPQHQVTGAAGFEDIWATWFTEKDITRVYTILSNFRAKETVREVTRRLCEMTAKSNTALNPKEEAGAVNIILANLVVFPQDEELAELGLRALWKVSVGDTDVLRAIAAEDGVQRALVIVETFPENEAIVQFGVVLLCNMTDAGIDVFTPHNGGERLLVLLLMAMKRFTDSLVLQKFSLAMLTRLLQWSPPCHVPPTVKEFNGKSFASRMVQEGLLEHVGNLLQRFRHGQVFLVERILEFVAELVQDRQALQLSRAPHTSPSASSRLQTTGTSVSRANYITHELIDVLVDVMLAHVGNDGIMVHGNAALWGLGNVPEYRAAILLNPQSHEALRLSIPSLVASNQA